MPTLPEPTWGDSEDAQKAYKESSALCNMRFTPSVVTGVFLRVLQAHFSAPDNIRDQKLKALLWKADPPSGDAIDSEILVAPLYMYDLRTLEMEPAVLVGHGELKATKFPMQSSYTLGLNSDGNLEGSQYSVPITGGTVISCVAGTAFAADRLAEEIFYFLLENAPVLLKDFPFSDLDVTSMSAPALVDRDSGERFKVDVGVVWRHIHGWTLKPIAPILKKIGLDVAAE